MHIMSVYIFLNPCNAHITPRVNPHKLCTIDNYDVSMWIHPCNKFITLVSDTDNEGGYACVG